MFKSIFDWLLDKGLVSATLILVAIYFVVFGIAMLALHLYHKYIH
jgi:hypothetical protein